MPSGQRLVLAVFAAAALAGCAVSPVTDVGAAVTLAAQEPDLPRVRQVGPAEAGTSVVLRVGEQLRVTPDPETSTRVWRLTAYPAALLRPRTPPAAPSHLFTAIAVGDGPLELTPDAGAASSPTSGPFTLRIRILRATAKG